ncbi:alpha/beta hydrolase [Streptomyces rectiviolaceus]|uniref:Alpha/beta hydrolase n=1 Tax=Streptomyces rectiviolaceus TaxID=332591 RepID=A0ABP6M808_9ACTN
MATNGHIAAARVATLAALTALTPFLAAPAADPPDLTRFYGQSISWENCGDEMEQEARRTWAASTDTLPAGIALFECGNVEVPRDYADPSGKAGTARIGMLRLRATDTERRIGSLVLNFGGPGLSGRFALNSHVPQLSRLNKRFDLVAHDPRGVADSDPVLCQDPPDGSTADSGHDQTPDNAGEAERIAEAQRTTNARCDQKETAKVLPWVGTTNSARDLDVMRAALGDDKLDYLGFSYGTKLGANYLHQFPDRAGHFVLDGVDDPTLDTHGVALANTKAFQQALDDFLADCVGRGARECPLGTTPRAATAKVNAMFTALDQKPLKTGTGELDQATFTQVVQKALYSKAKGWPDLRAALADLAARNDATSMAELGGRPVGGLAAPRAPAAVDERDQEEQDSLRAISCRDTGERPTPQDFLDAVDEFTQASPVFGRRTAASMLQCTGWPVPGDDTSRQVKADNAPAALLVGTRGDPATPYEGTAHMADALDNGSGILTYEGEGHGAYVTDSDCVHEHVDRFLAEGKLPPQDTTCR